MSFEFRMLFKNSSSICEVSRYRAGTRIEITPESVFFNKKKTTKKQKQQQQKKKIYIYIKALQTYIDIWTSVKDLISQNAVACWISLNCNSVNSTPCIEPF